MPSRGVRRRRPPGWAPAGRRAVGCPPSDHNGYKQEGLHIAQSVIHDGLRWSAARGYLRPAMRRPNLHVMLKTLVTKVLIEDGAATGIEVLDRGRPRRITSDREVIVCAGAINTPKLLMLSGVGDPDELRRHGIDVVA